MVADYFSSSSAYHTRQSSSSKSRSRLSAAELSWEQWECYRRHEIGSSSVSLITLRAALRFTGGDVAAALADVAQDRGVLPVVIQCDNGAEFTSTVLDHLA